MYNFNEQWGYEKWNGMKESYKFTTNISKYVGKCGICVVEESALHHVCDKRNKWNPVASSLARQHTWKYIIIQ